MDLVEVTPPAESAALDVVSVEALRRHLRMLSTDRDTELSEAISDACAMLHGKNGVLNRAFMQSDWRLYLPELGSSPIEIPMPPMISLTSISYTDDADSEVTIDPATYRSYSDGLFSLVAPKSGSWPSMTPYPRRAKIDFRAGYQAAGPNFIPDPLKRAVKLMAGHFIENSEATINELRLTIVNRKLEYGWSFLIEPFRILNDIS